MDDIQIQIINYKTKSYLIECLRSVFKDLETSRIKYSISILENGSGDNLSEIYKLFSDSHITIQTSEKNLGFGGGHNFLAHQGNAQYLLFLNPDIKIIEPNTILRLIEKVQKSDTWIVGPRLVTDENKTQQWDHGELHGLLAWVALHSSSSYWREQNQPTEVAWVSGATFLIKKKYFDDIGGFDENFFLYKEEEDLCWRVREKGGVIIYDPTISVFHHGGVVAKKSDYLQKSINYFIEKHYKNSISCHIYKFLNKIIN